MTKIVINTCYGGFGLSTKGEEEYLKIKNLYDETNFYSRDIPRDDPALVQVVEQLGSASSDSFAKLKVIEIPDDVEWEIKECDGIEWIAEKHRIWG